MEHESEKRFPACPKDYELYEEIGEGVSATVRRALCIPLNEIVAIKILDLEKCNNDLDGIRREVQTMSLIDHPNVLRAHCSFTSGHDLWVVMPYMAGGSALHIMKFAYPEGFEELVIATLLREVLKALVYLHSHGHIHRDVKAGNILIDGNGAVKLADFGVSACMFDTGDRQRSRNTFVGTPCWMAPEVMQQLHGYDFKADIWSFGITALELAHGHAPFSKYPPMKVLLMTLQNAPPGLDYERDKRFSKSFKDLVATCLVKDPKKRPSSEKLLKHAFFKHARSNEYLEKSILDNLSPLGERFRMLKSKEADFLLHNKGLPGEKEQLSQREYIRGISGWNFNLEDLKAQAARLETSDGALPSEEVDNISNTKDAFDEADIQQQIRSSESVNNSSSATSPEVDIQDIQELEGPFASAFASRPLEALKSCFDVCDDETDANSPILKAHLNSESRFPSEQSSQLGDLRAAKCNGDNLERSVSVPTNISVLGCQKFSSGSLLPEHVLSPYRRTSGDTERDELHRKHHNERNHSGPLSFRQMRDAQAQQEPSEEKVVQRRGRFKVTSSDVTPKVASTANSKADQFSGTPTRRTLNGPALLPPLQFLLQQNAMQREQLLKLMACVEQTSGFHSEVSDAGTSDSSQLCQASSREKELQAYVAHLEQGIMELAQEVQKLKTKNTQLERQINALTSKEDRVRRR
ncbi:serine/threonine-protein kinase BLUS1 isoform X1 [Ananas comosus]|uniref:Serine/threonine-protein kinase BLUS1 isoform X1 n=1 Tax=Ananas comosus TaxID=4615 RepID=A0A6P5F4R8_ANACO|nr:serine/threonine-protein kinase BLUS1 isoform X1 [Ananas comosus]XP_020088261.1 serine/threonine-protein kinase BLUS1 isoform X1 [Ananas comosus]